METTPCNPGIMHRLGSKDRALRWVTIIVLERRTEFHGYGMNCASLHV